MAPAQFVKHNSSCIIIGEVSEFKIIYNVDRSSWYILN